MRTTRAPAPPRCRSACASACRLGLSIGTAIGAATKNIGLWMPLGISFGMCLSLLLGHKKSGDDTDDET